MCSFGYYSRLPYLVEMSGLTQYSLAQRPLERRGRVGHEKAPTVQWMTENEIHLLVHKAFPPVPPPEDPPRVDEVRFGDVAVARIRLYSDAVMDPLRSLPGVSFVPIEETIVSALHDIERATPEEAERIYASLHRYYFRAAGERAQQVARHLRARVDARHTAAGSAP